jgi:hypothetical protein
VDLSLVGNLTVCDNPSSSSICRSVWLITAECVCEDEFGGVMLAIKAEIGSEPVDIDTPCELIHARSITTLMIVSL